MVSIRVLPPEVICQVLCFVSPRDIIQLRLVSKQFYIHTYDITVWRTLYMKARLPRPSGPFPSQSVQFLERTLVQSERLTHSWTTQPIRDISTTAIPMPGMLSSLSVILHGKWLVNCESPTTFVVYDFDSNAESHTHQLLWKADSEILSWDACPVVSNSGLLIYVVCRIATDQIFSPWTLLEFCVNGDSLRHTLTLEVPTKKSEESVCLNGGHSPFVYFMGQRLIFDAETRLFYEFPEFKSTLVEVSSNSHSSGRNPLLILLTKTHVIALFHHIERTVSHTNLSTLIQAFTIPANPCPAHDIGIGFLLLSHEGVTPGHIQSFDLIRNSIVDAVSGATSIRFLRQFLEGKSLHFSCIDLTLPKHTSTSTVLPMTIDLDDITHVNHGSFESSLGHMHFVESSDDGHVRGLWRFVMPHASFESISFPFPIMRFTIDASGDRCVATLGQISAPQWKKIHDPPWSRSILFDGVRGRLCYHTLRYVLDVDIHDDEASAIINIQ